MADYKKVNYSLVIRGGSIFAPQNHKHNNYAPFEID